MIVAGQEIEAVVHFGGLGFVLAGFGEAFLWLFPRDWGGAHWTSMDSIRVHTFPICDILGE